MHACGDSCEAVEARAGESQLYTPLSSTAPLGDPHIALNTWGAVSLAFCNQ